MDFFKKTWVNILAIVMFIVSIVLMSLSGWTKADFSPILDQVVVILDLVTALIVAIKKLLQKKATTNK